MKWGIIICGGIIFVFVLLVPSNVAGTDWWNTTFSARQVLEVNTSSPKYGIQPLITIPHDVDMQAGGGDIRIVTNCSTDAQPIPIYNITQVDGSYFHIRLKTSTDAALCLYYGNAGALPVWDGNDTLMFWDDGETYADTSVLVGQGGWQQYDAWPYTDIFVTNHFAYTGSQCIMAISDPATQGAFHYTPLVDHVVYSVMMWANGTTPDGRIITRTAGDALMYVRIQTDIDYYKTVGGWQTMVTRINRESWYKINLTQYTDQHVIICASNSTMTTCVNASVLTPGGVASIMKLSKDTGTSDSVTLFDRMYAANISDYQDFTYSLGPKQGQVSGHVFTIDIESPDNITYTNNRIWLNVTVNEFVGNVSAEVDGAANYTLINSTGNWNYDITNLTDGGHFVKFVVNETNWSTTVFFTVSTVPSVVQNTPANGATASKGSVPFVFTPIDNGPLLSCSIMLNETSGGGQWNTTAYEVMPACAADPHLYINASGDTFFTMNDCTASPEEVQYRNASDSPFGSLDSIIQMDTGGAAFTENDITVFPNGSLLGIIAPAAGGCITRISDNKGQDWYSAGTIGSDCDNPFFLYLTKGDKKGCYLVVNGYGSSPNRGMKTYLSCDNSSTWTEQGIVCTAGALDCNDGSVAWYDDGSENGTIVIPYEYNGPNGAGDLGYSINLTTSQNNGLTMTPDVTVNDNATAIEFNPRIVILEVGIGEYSAGDWLIAWHQGPSIGVNYDYMLKANSSHTDWSHNPEIIMGANDEYIWGGGDIGQDPNTGEIFNLMFNSSASGDRKGYLINYYDSTTEKMVMNTSNTSALVNGSTNTISVVMPVGHYKWSVNCTDYFGNENVTGNFTLYLISDNTPPQITIQRPVNTTYANSTVWFNVTMNESGGECVLDFDSINYSMTNSTGNWNYLNATVPDGSHQATFWCNDSFNNMNSTSIIFSIDTSPPVLTNVINHTIGLGTSFSYDIDATNVSPIDSFVLNDTNNFTINIATGVITNSTTLILVATYWLNVSVNDTLGNLAWKIFFINVTNTTTVISDERMGILIGSIFDIAKNRWSINFETQALYEFLYIKPPRRQDSSMPNNSIYYSTDATVLVYKDPSGTVNNLYGDETYGEMWNRTNSDNPFVFPIAATGVYYNLTNLTEGGVNGFAFTTNDTSLGGSYLTAQVAGRYRITASISSVIGTASGDLYGYAASLNFERSGNNNCYARRTAVNKAGNIGITCFMDMAVGDHVNIQIEQESGGVARDMAIHTVNINLVRIGG